MIVEAPCAGARRGRSRCELRALRPRQHRVQDVQHVAPAAARRDHRVDVVAVEQRADAVAVPREQPREHRDELGRHRALAARSREPKSTDGAQVEQEPRGDLAVLVDTRARTASAAAR